ncbi:MAG: hypothetical protein ACJAVI_001253 [Candidatus Azotimanducaceae bacterium]|jgi:hypothetical protein
MGLEHPEVNRDSEIVPIWRDKDEGKAYLVSKG